MISKNSVIHDLEAVILPENKVSVRWKVNNSLIAPGDIFEIQRGLSLTELEAIDKNITSNFFLDDDVNLYSKWRDFYYRVVVKRYSAREDKYKEIFTADCNIRNKLNDPIANIISYRNNIVRKNYQKNLGTVFVKKTFGERCKSCYDENYGTVSNSSCDECLGTTFVGGFFNPVKNVPYQVGAAPKKSTAMDPERMEIESRNFNISGHPILNSGDIFIDRFNSLWRIENVTSTVHNGGLTHQTALCRRLDYNTIEHKLIERM